MIYIAIKQNVVYTFVESFEATKAYTAVDRWENRHDWETKAQVDGLAEDLTNAIRRPGRKFIGVDRGASVSPRFDVIEAPAVGDVVSMGFNGDYYPCGKIVSISATMKKIVTDSGKAFYRRRQSGTWLYNGTFALIPGVHDERNPHI